MKYRKLMQVLHNLRFVKDTSKYHSEANVLEHSLQTYYLAKRESDDKDLWVAAIMHDLGKGIEMLGHDKISVDILKSFGYTTPKVLWLIENHIRIINFIDGSMKRLKKSKGFISHPWFLSLVHLRRLDYSGRNPNKSSKLNWEEVNSLLGETNDS